MLTHLPTMSAPIRRVAGRLLTAGIVLLAPSIAQAVTVTPSAVYITSRTRSGTVTLINTGTRAEDIDITFAFGYPQVDIHGVVSVPISPTAPDSEPSAVGWLRAFPRRIRLLPGQRQVVRIIAEPPAGLEAREYWARMMIASRGAQAPVEQQQDRVKVSVEVQTVIATAVSYRNGTLTTDVAVTDRGAVLSDSGIKLNLDLKRTGTAAFIGHLRAELLDRAGAVVSASEEDIAVYHSMSRAFLIPVPPNRRPTVWTGYTVRYTIDTERPDLPPGSALPADTKRAQVPVRGG